MLSITDRCWVLLYCYAHEINFLPYLLHFFRSLMLESIDKSAVPNVGGFFVCFFPNKSIKEIVEFPLRLVFLRSSSSSYMYIVSSSSVYTEYTYTHTHIYI